MRRKNMKALMWLSTVLQHTAIAKLDASPLIWNPDFNGWAGNGPPFFVCRRP